MATMRWATATAGRAYLAMTRKCLMPSSPPLQTPTCIHRILWVPMLPTSTAAGSTGKSIPRGACRAEDTRPCTP